MTTARGQTSDQLGDAASKSWYKEIGEYKYPKNAAAGYADCVQWHKIGHFSQVPVRINITKKHFAIDFAWISEIQKDIVMVIFRILMWK